MEQTEENKAEEPCAICGKETNGDRTFPALFIGRICVDCEHSTKRNKIAVAWQTELEKDYKAFLDGKRDYPIQVRIVCDSGEEILSPVSDKLARAFLNQK